MKSLLEKKVCDPTPLPVVSLNHVSFLCSSLHESVRFYEEVLGFQLIRRPSSFDFQGAWFYNYGIGIHLVQSPEAVSKPSEINPKANHISFQCADMGRVKQRLDQMGITYVTAVVTEGGIRVDQLFFHDPDNNMIEICDCEKLPIVPLSFPFAPLKTPQFCTGSNRSLRRHRSVASIGWIRQ
ncbi:glyoxylase I 4-like isoform X2 [Musa acuminata AAA Group]|uniref:glyoxylase I 4-like isoform X2 n=1 Tax=Musa acuminata AAA Group TaxID=214697 RepID=UPI0031D98A8E